MIATWMLYATLIGLFAAVAAWTLDRAARALGVAGRYVWLAAMIATLFAPVAGYVWRRAGMGFPVARATVGQPTALAFTEVPVSSPTVVIRLVAAAKSVATRLDRPVAYLWAALTLLLLGRLAFATTMLWRRRSEWTTRQIDGLPIYVTPDLGPAVVALPSSRILVPEWLLGLDSAHVATVLRHEREHHDAGDARLLVAATVMTALVPWNPAVWWQSRRLRLAVEMDCDARVLRADPRVDRYGTLLLAIAQHPRATLHAAATLTESTSDLERRIDAMTTPRPSAPRVLAGALATAAIAAIFAACVTPAPDVIAGPSGRREVVVSGPPRRMDPDSAMFDFQVEKPARPAADNPTPAYPNQLRAANIGGVVVAKFVVDTTGRVDMKSYEVVKSDHELFTNAVRDAMPQMRWIPAEVGGRKVKQLVAMPFVFSLSRNGSLTEVPVVGPPILRRDSPVPARLSEKVTIGTTEYVTGGQSNNSPPRYPNQLRAANIEGQVVARFVVRPDGTVDTSTIVIAKSDHELFSNSVREALSSYRFAPPMMNGVAVRKLVTMPFIFSLSK